MKRGVLRSMPRQALSAVRALPAVLDPFTDPPTKLKEKDIIALKVEGTGFAAKTEEKKLKVTSESKPALV